MRTEAPPQDRREQILSAAQRLWGRQGYHAVSLRSIAAEAGVSLALLDHHFGSKHLLFAEAVRPLGDACQRALQDLRAAAPQSGEARALQLAQALLQPALPGQGTAAQADVLRLWLQHRYDPLPEVRVPLDRAAMELIKAVAEALSAHAPGVPAWQRTKLCVMVFGEALEWLAGADTHTPQAPDAAEALPQAMSPERILQRMTRSLWLAPPDDAGDLRPLPEAA